MRMFSFFTRNKEKPLTETNDFAERDIEFSKKLSPDAEYSSELSRDNEFSSDMTYENQFTLAVPDNSYSNSGVYMTAFNDNVKLTYEGLLADSGADGVYAVVDHENSSKLSDYYPMTKITSGSFEVQFPITNAKNISIAFKDSANNWDNNNGVNYTYSNFSEGSL